MTVTREFLTVPIADLHPNPWNPNRMDDRTYDAARESIHEYGFVDPVTTRERAEGGWEIIDGEHRVRAAEDEGHDDVDVVVLHGLSETETRKLTVILNETRGEANPPQLGRVLVDLLASADGDLTVLTRALRYSDAEVKHLLQIGREDWDTDYEPELPILEGGADVGWLTVACRVPDQVIPRWEEAVSRMGIEHDDDHVRNGLVLEALAAEYLAGRRDS